MPLLRSWLVAFAALAPSVLLAAPLPVQVTKFEGEVVQVAGTAHSGIVPGRNLEAGTEIRTGNDGRAQLSLHGDPTLALGNGVQLLVHSMDQRVLRLRIASGAVRVDARPAKGGKSRDVRLNVGDLRVRVAGADAWIELGERGGQVCLISGTVEAQQSNGVARLDTPGQCLRQSGLTSQWSMVPVAVLQERIALLGVREAEVATRTEEAPKPIVVEPAPKVVAIPVPPAIETAPAPAAQSSVKPPAAVAVVEIPPPPAPPKLEVAPAAASTATVALAAPVEVVAVPPMPVPPALDPAPAAASATVIALPKTVEVPEVPPAPAVKPATAITKAPATKPAAVIEAPVAQAAAPAAVSPSWDSVKPDAGLAAPAPAATDVVPATATVAMNVQAAEVLPVPEPPAAAKPAEPVPAPQVEAAASPATAPAEPKAEPAAESASTPAPTGTTEVATAASASEPAVDDGRRWRVVLGSMPEREAAERESERLNARGWAVEPREYRVGERHGFRIGFGEFATREDAQKALDEFLGQFPDAPGWLAKY